MKVNEKSLANLKMNFTKEERSANGKKGSAITNEKIKQKKRIREALEMILDMQDPDAMSGIDQTNAYGIALAMVDKAKKGDVSAAVYVRDSSGEKPVDKQEVEVGELKKLVVEVKE